MMVRSAATVVRFTSFCSKHVDAERDQRVVEHGDDAAGRETQVEAERDVQHDERDRVEQRLNRGVAELLACLRTDPLDAKRSVGRALAELLPKLLCQLVGDADEVAS